MEAEPTYKELSQNERLKQQNRELKKQLGELMLADARTDALVEAIQTEVAVREPVPPARLKKLGRGVMQMGGVLDLGDWHYGEVVDAKATGGTHQYNTEIAKERFDYTIDEAIRLAQMYEIQELDVVLGGDMISGNIHTDLERHNEVMTIEQTLGMAEVTYSGLEKLCQAFAEVRVHGVSGNHARMDKVPYFKKKQVENLDYLMYKICEQKGKDQPNLKFNIPESIWTVFETQGRAFLTLHGDTNRHQNSMGISFYSLEKFLRTFALEGYVGNIPKFDDMITHHLHTAADIPVGELTIFVNGSGKGPDEYSGGGLRPQSRAQQRFLAVGAGKVVGSHLIDLEHIGKPDGS